MSSQTASIHVPCGHANSTSYRMPLIIFARNLAAAHTITHDGRTLRMLVLIDEYTRECLAIRMARRLGSYEVIETLADVMLRRGIPEHIRSDNGPEFVAKELRKWLGKVGTGTLYIEPGSPWENGYCESFNGKLRDERGCDYLPGIRASSLGDRAATLRWRRAWNVIRFCRSRLVPISQIIGM